MNRFFIWAFSSLLILNLVSCKSNSQPNSDENAEDTVSNFDLSPDEEREFDIAEAYKYKDIAFKDNTGDISNLMLGYVKTPEAVRVLMKEESVFNPQNNFNYSNQLYSTARNGRADVVKTILSAIPNIQADNETLMHALSEAAENGHADVVKILLDAGADVKNSDALSQAALNGHADVVKILLKAGADVKNSSAISNAALNGHADVIKILLDAGADIQSTDQKGRTPLHLAARNDHFKAVKLLLSAGADIHATYQKDYYTPLFDAVSQSCYPEDKDMSEYKLIIYALVSAGAYLNLEKLNAGIFCNYSINTWNSDFRMITEYYNSHRGQCKMSCNKTYHADKNKDAWESCMKSCKEQWE